MYLSGPNMARIDAVLGPVGKLEVIFDVQTRGVGTRGPFGVGNTRFARRADDWKTYPLRNVGLRIKRGGSASDCKGQIGLS
jgi:hypothetical protein